VATLDWSRCPAVESLPGKVGGAWVFKGTRLPVATIIENLEDLGIDEVIEQFDVSREQITAVLDFVAESLRADPIPTRLVLFDHGTRRGLSARFLGTPFTPHKPRAGTRSATAHS
jgi:uncharacterized protein (DUF433 family)